LAAPVVEEFICRGLLLTRWSLKWDIPRAVFLSSLVFGLLHCDSRAIHCFFHGVVLSVVYIETKSLILPICMHMANNGIAWLMIAVSPLIDDSDISTAIEQWPADWWWWIGLAVTALAAPWIVWFVKRHFPRRDWVVPYLSLGRSIERGEGSLRAA